MLITMEPLEHRGENTFLTLREGNPQGLFVWAMFSFHFPECFVA